jgi:hypothetical protein
LRGVCLTKLYDKVSVTDTTLIIYIHTYHSRFIPEGVAETPTFYQNYLATRNTADVKGGKPIAVLLLSVTDISAINPLVAFYDIHGGKREVLFFYVVPDTTRDFF